MLSGFSRVPLDLVGAWAAAGVSRPALVLLMLLAHQGADKQGRLYGSCPRSEMARVLGCSDTAIKQAIRGLRDNGLLSVKTAGCRGRASEYYFGLGTDRGIKSLTPKDYLGVCNPYPLSPKKGVSGRYPKVRDRGMQQIPPSGDRGMRQIPQSEDRGIKSYTPIYYEGESIGRRAGITPAPTTKSQGASEDGGAIRPSRPLTGNEYDRETDGFVDAFFGIGGNGNEQ